MVPSIDFCTLYLGFRSFTEKSIPSVIISHRYKAQDTPARKTFEQALTGAFMSAVIKDLRPSALPFVASLIRHYTMVAVAQQCGEQMFNYEQRLRWESLVSSCARLCVCYLEKGGSAVRFVQYILSLSILRASFLSVLRPGSASPVQPMLLDTMQFKRLPLKKISVSCL